MGEAKTEHAKFLKITGIGQTLDTPPKNKTCMITVGSVVAGIDLSREKITVGSLLHPGGDRGSHGSQCFPFLRHAHFIEQFSAERCGFVARYEHGDLWPTRLDARLDFSAKFVAGMEMATSTMSRE